MSSFLHKTTFWQVRSFGVLLLPTYRQSLKSKAPEIKTAKRWSREAEEQLQNCLDSVDWAILKNSSEDLNDYTGVVTGFTKTVVDDCVPTKSFRVYPNQKARMNNVIRNLLRTRSEAFKSGDQDCYNRCSNSRPVHCREAKKCFNYDLICENSGYEVRHYNSSTWIATNVTSFFMEFASYEGFTKLFQYIQGKNEEGKKINMAAPVLLKIPESERIMEMKNYTVHFLLPEAYQENPPTPTDPDVYFIEFPKMYVFVKSFGGSLLTWNSKFYSSRLKAELNKADQSFISDYYYGTGYNRPKMLFDQHNEVWYVAEGTPECSTLVPEHTT
ncbi:heme-binding protein 2-like [Mobula hypostoma]|uniref:heme-binding protein 2-like n=1 Tax=Mobula hypostoma TaxID=723540 RepID=UPI002FC2AC4D